MGHSAFYSEIKIFIGCFMKRHRNSTAQQEIGRSRIFRLFKMADNSFEKHPERAHRYVQLARKIAMRYGIRIPVPLKRHYCRKCYKYLSPNINCSIRKAGDSVFVKCLECGNVMKMSGG
jgi:ribonuclease P protein subunit RPR2